MGNCQLSLANLKRHLMKNKVHKSGNHTLWNDNELCDVYFTRYQVHEPITIERTKCTCHPSAKRRKTSVSKSQSNLIGWVDSEGFSNHSKIPLEIAPMDELETYLSLTLVQRRLLVSHHWINHRNIAFTSENYLFTVSLCHPLVTFSWQLARWIRQTFHPTVSKQTGRGIQWVIEVIIEERVAGDYQVIEWVNQGMRSSFTL